MSSASSTQEAVRPKPARGDNRRLRVGREMGEGPRVVGTHVYLWQIHVDVWQKPSQYCKVIILQLK